MSAADRIALELSRWFEEGLTCYEGVTSGLAGGDPSRARLVAHGAIERAAQKLVARSAEQDRSALFSSTCILLGAASQLLGLRVTPENWKAALENVLELEPKLSEAQAAGFGIPACTSALFLEELGTQLDHAGFVRAPSDLNEANRRRALALAINFGLRFLVAIGLEPSSHSDPAYQRFKDRLSPLQSARSAT